MSELELSLFRQRSQEALKQRRAAASYSSVLRSGLAPRDQDQAAKEGTRSALGSGGAPGGNRDRGSGWFKGRATALDKLLVTLGRDGLNRNQYLLQGLVVVPARYLVLPIAFL